MFEGHFKDPSVTVLLMLLNVYAFCNVIRQATNQTVEKQVNPESGLAERKNHYTCMQIGESSHTD